VIEAGGGLVEGGEVWWALIDERCPVVLLSGADAAEVRTVRVASPATTAEKRGFLVLTGEQAADDAERHRLIAAAGHGVAAIGVEVAIGAAEGLAEAGVVRVALPRDGTIFCTWLMTLPPDCLLERAGALSPGKLHQLQNALRLAATAP
jgi:mRNA interferase MazF